jgi:hypothetical protein
MVSRHVERLSDIYVSRHVGLIQHGAYIGASIEHVPRLPMLVGSSQGDAATAVLPSGRRFEARWHGPSPAVFLVSQQNADGPGLTASVLKIN